MPIDNLYHITSLEYNTDSGVLNAQLALNKSHPVFEGHFPGNPILPGVCTVQIAKELLCKVLQGNFRLSKAANIKYLGFVSPVSTPVIRFQMIIKQIDTLVTNCSVTVIAGENTVCSFKGEYLQI
ncbi:MAG TPA: hypothetical protein VHI78_08900 [Bacteroidales bacterium]|jgi:3-hydroxyacyl-[acyl-carrier-protein] dehydratase|nr:hypothetical protein [Bacteroidales bacterium]